MPVCLKSILSKNRAGAGGEHVDDRAGPEDLGGDIKSALQT